MVQFVRCITYSIGRPLFIAVARKGNGEDLERRRNEKHEEERETTVVYERGGERRVKTYRINSKLTGNVAREQSNI